MRVGHKLELGRQLTVIADVQDAVRLRTGLHLAEVKRLG